MHVNISSWENEQFSIFQRNIKLLETGRKFGHTSDSNDLN